MAVFRRRPALLRLAAVLLALSPLALLGCAHVDFPQSALHPTSDYARSLQQLLESLVFWVMVIFVVVEGLLIVAVMKFRSRPGTAEPKPVHGNTMLEVGWTVAPAIVLAFIAVPTVLTIFRTQGAPPVGAMRVKAIGHQWWWEFQYPEQGLITASEMHVPAGRPVVMDIETGDVIHSFWFPSVGGKRDAIPGRTNHFWFTADSIGSFPGQCAELCGTSHANMRMKLMVEAPEDFDAWVASQKTAPAEPDSGSLAWQGKQLFSQQACIGCHTIDGISAGVIGPNLNHLGSRTSLAGATYDNTPENLGKWIANPPERKPGSLMPALGLQPDQVAALVAYLQSLK